MKLTLRPYAGAGRFFVEGDEKLRRKLLFPAAVLLCLFLLAGCKGKPLPEGMKEDAVLSAGREIVELLVAGDCQIVYDRLRPDVRDSTTVEAISQLLTETLDGAGDYREEGNTMVTGITDASEPQGIAVIYCKYSKKNIRFRIAFDPDMELIGFAMAKK